MSNPLDDACRQVVEQVEGATGCGVVDLDAGMLVGVHTTEQYDPALTDLVALATTEVFRGPNVTRIEELVRAHLGLPASGEHYVREVYVASDRVAHFIRAIKAGRAALMLVTGHTTNVGLGWSQLRAAAAQIEELVP